MNIGKSNATSFKKGREFDGHVLRLLQMTGKAKPARFANTNRNALVRQVF